MGRPCCTRRPARQRLRAGRRAGSHRAGGDERDGVFRWSPRIRRYTRSPAPADAPRTLCALDRKAGDLTDFSRRVAARFDNAAASYDAHSAAQRHAARRLAERIVPLGLSPRPRVLEIGCGTGHLTEQLAIHHERDPSQRMPVAHEIGRKGPDKRVYT